MVKNLELSPIKFYNTANNMLEKKDLIEFITNISKAELLSARDQEMYSKTLFLKAKGLFYFNQHKKALEAIKSALEYNSNEDMLNLRIYEGIIHGYLGEFDKAIDIFKTIITQTEDKLILAKSYLNITWVYLGFDYNKLDDKKLNESKKYLDLVNEYFEALSNKMKLRLLTNYSVYYYFKEEFKKAIELLEACIKYCQEQDLSDVYNNLAELHIKSDILETAKEYLEKAEILGSKYSKNISLGHTFKYKAEVELLEDQLFTALDTLYLAFEHFKNAEATTLACDCLMEINKLMNDYKNNSLKALTNSLKK